jgi:hypothetical protein
MNKKPDIIRSAAADDDELRRQCLKGTELYRQALIQTGYMRGTAA